MKTLLENKKFRKELKTEYKKNRKKFIIKICMGTSSICSGAKEIFKTFESEIKKNKISDTEIIPVGETGLNSLEPIAIIHEKGKDPIQYIQLTPAKIKKIIKQHIIEGNIVKEYLTN
ncbi:MAG: (2Fe-2S) ferredoxin domain-containing protein [Candidatus Cloacimonetes bacterium]|nr:(2Fe-2S) ferredoxin domain-containing protein [Candidatus Cloacimonadota bacterium]